jgi:hypothetical protein
MEESYTIEELFPMRESYKNNKNCNRDMKKEFKEFCESQLANVVDPIVKDVVSEHRFDHYFEFGWYLFNQIYKEIPSEIHLEARYKIEMLDFFQKNATPLYRKIQDSDEDGEISEISYAFFYKKAVVFFNYYFNFKETTKFIKGLHIFHSINNNVCLEEFRSFEKPLKGVPKIGIIKQTKFGPQVTWRDFDSGKQFDEDNYNDDFPEFLKNFSKKISTENNGLYLMYGETGTGKSSAIRHFIKQIDRSFVFIPPQMVNYLSTPEFVDLVTTSLKHCVLIIEDAEKALMKRESDDGFHNSELVSSLLNLTDGLYADISSTSIIATYNCDRNLIDPALLRKGRMKAEYKFNRLSVKKSQKLMDKLGHDVKVEEEMTLADIYNYEKQYTNEERNDKKKNIGFGFGAR